MARDGPKGHMRGPHVTITIDTLATCQISLINLHALFHLFHTPQQLCGVGTTIAFLIVRELSHRQVERAPGHPAIHGQASL